MPRRFKLVCFFFSLSVTLYAQDTTCNCLENLVQTIQKTEANYAGFPAKVTASTSRGYNSLVQRLKQKAQPETNAKKCYYILQQYIRFFRDKHFVLSYNNEKDFDSSVVHTSEAALRKQWKNKQLSPVEGIWISPDSVTKIAVVKANDGSFKAIKMESAADHFPTGFVYFTLTPNNGQYIVKEYNYFLTTATPAKQTGNLLQIWNHAMWGKLYPQQMTGKEEAELATWKKGNNGLAFKKLNADVAYLKIPTFLNNDNAIQQLVAANDSVIRNTEYLLVDLTGNGGGNTGWIYFLPYFMTNPVVQKPSFVRVTPENVQLKLQDIEPFVANPVSEEYKKYFPDDILNLYKKAYRELPVTSEKFYPVPGVTFPLDSITRNPKKIALIVDNFCGSSAEYFFYLSKQSKKTVSYGRNTIGMMDYEGMSIPTPLPYSQFRLTIPIVKSSWTDTKPIDQTGFQPDVILNIPQHQWIDAIVKDIMKR